MARLVLVAGFREFGARRRNESEVVVRALAASGAFRGRARFLVLPVAWRRGPAIAARAATRDDVGAVVLLGEAGTRGRVTPEVSARNVAGPHVDEDGRRPAGPRLARGGPARLASTWRVSDLLEAVRGARVPCAASRDAGAFLCNATFYAVLRALRRAKRRVPVTFVHLPVPRPDGVSDVRPAALARAARAVVERAAGRLSATPAPRRRSPRRRSRRATRPRPLLRS